MGISEKELNKLGIVYKGDLKVKNTDELKKNTPGFVLAQVLSDCSIIVESVPVSMKRGNVICMPLTFYFKSKRSDKRRILLKPYRKQFKDFFKRYNGENLDGKSILITRTGGIGDIIFSLPICRFLKEKYPTCKIIFATSPKNKLLFDCFPKGLVEYVVSIPFSKEILDKVNYHLFFEGAIERNKEAETVNAYDLFARVAGLDIDQTDERYKPVMKTPPELLKDFQEVVPKRYILLQLKASSPTRMLNTESWKYILGELDKKLDKDIKFAFVDNETRVGMYDDIINEIFTEDNKHRAVNLCKYSKSLKHLCAITELSEMVLGIDSSISHFAGALKKPLVCVYGPFRGSTRIKYYDNATIIEPESCDCAKWPCFYHSNEISKCTYVMSGVPAICMNNAVDKDKIIQSVCEVFERK